MRARGQPSGADASPHARPVPTHPQRPPDTARGAHGRPSALSTPPEGKARFWRRTAIWTALLFLPLAGLAEPLDEETLGGAVIVAFACGALAAYVLRRQRYEVATDHPDGFLAAFCEQAADIGYHRFAREGDEVKFSPGFWAGYASGKIVVRLEPDHATVTGPGYHMKRLRQRASAD